MWIPLVGLPWILLAPEGGGAAGASAGLARGSNAFGFELWRRLPERQANLAISPASLALALIMTGAGARGETATQMQRVLHLGAPAEALLAAAGGLARELADPARPVVLRIANRLFGEQTQRFEAAYRDALSGAFGAPLEPVDFKAAAEQARERINAWVEAETQQRIRGLVPQGGVDVATRLVLVNALYFLGDWAEPFDPARTHPAPFQLSAGARVEVPTMRQTGTLPYAKRDGFAAVELPYRGGELAMLLVVPDGPQGLAVLEKAVDAAWLARLAAALTPQLVQVHLPRFEVKPARSLAVGPALQELGMRLAFDPARADFGGIARWRSPEERLCLGEVFHQAFVKVDEQGTEAAAATAVAMLAGGAPPRPVQFVADRPFLFFLRDRRSDLVLFMGRVADPRGG